VDEIEWGDWKVGEFSGSLLDIMRGPVLTLGFGLIGGSILILILMRYLPNIPLFQFLVVHKELASGASITDGRTEGETRVGWTGETLTDLRPAGKAQFSDDELDVIADGTFIPKGAKVRIVEEDGMRVVVCEIEAT
jgi:membrane-bound serine protease (ClpP class)